MLKSIHIYKGYSMLPCPFHVVGGLFEENECNIGIEDNCCDCSVGDLWEEREKLRSALLFLRQTHFEGRGDCLSDALIEADNALAAVSY